MFISTNPGADALFQLELVPLVVFMLWFGGWCIYKAITRTET